MVSPTADYVRVIQTALWQFNESVSLLRESRNYLPEATGLAEEIDESLPTITEALRSLAGLDLSHIGRTETGED
jgi:hypothetical protein